MPMHASFVRGDVISVIRTNAHGVAGKGLVPGDIVKVNMVESPPFVGLVVERRQEKAKHVVNRGGFVETITIMAASGQTYSIPCTAAWSKKIEVLNEDA